MTTTMFDELNFGLWLGAFFATFGFIRILISCKMYMETNLMDDRAAEVLAHFTTAKSAKAVSTSTSSSSSSSSPQRSTTTHNKSPRKKHSVTPNKWSKQNGRDEFSSNEDLATCSGDVANVPNYDEDPGVVDDVNTSESESSPKIRRKHKKKSTPRQRGACKKIATTDGNEENKENNCLSSNPQKLDGQDGGATKQIFAADRFMTEFNRCRAITPPLREHIKLNLPEDKLIQFLKHYLLNSNDLKAQGYPYRYGTKAGFFKKRFSASVDYCVPPVSIITSFDVNAREFVPSHKRRSCERKSSCDSGQATGSSSSSSSSSLSSSSSSPSTDSDSSDNAGELRYIERTEKKCIRCTREFHVTEHGEYLKMETCTYHWGKLERSSISYSMGGTYTCCNSPKFTKGCTTIDGHVWNGYEMGFNGPLDGFVRTEDSDKIDNELNVFALDCEMCYTGKGLEVTKVTLVSSDGQKLYEKFVRPATKIIDYNTRFSGITKKDLATKNNLVATLPEVQQDLLHFINADTILIGHALENDLRVLKIIHDNVIDTSVCFPHENGPGYKHSLRFLTSKYLNRSIQDSDQGHSSFEDSRACLELMLWRVRKDFRAVLEQ
ncbi:uncharacterized protein LOC129566202 isoform X2 [Sitodiplosis mosellana]|uniref:uncharacterized protein LOC129566202 isoform X2 n=1 Tax=Sitodiplosis mosellana TaxID=263140 RepID=UPI00244494E3|nr:uncharacterized protein LOC129566202 isoform X2 [Sitodiplosis mosellana]XP_055297903.1 uncharacterized protein LOC129566202 isoform X2 [Sitodiplosis mosellana]